MAAPSSAYNTKVLKRKSGATLIEDIQMAKLLSEYGGVSGAKSKFYLDFVQKCVDNSSSEIYFIGIVDTTGANAPYHATARLGGIVSGTKKYLKDAGLNTKAPSDIATTTGYPKWLNWIEVPISVIPAYYVPNTYFGYQYKVGAGSWSADVEVGYNTSGSTFTAASGRIDLSSVALQGNTIYFKAYAENAEGKLYSTEVSITASEEISLLGANYISASDPQGALGSGVTIYSPASQAEDLGGVTTTDASTGIYLYTTAYANTYVADGYWYIGGYENKAFKVSNGQVLSYVQRQSAATQMNLYMRYEPFAEFPNPHYYVDAAVINGTFPNSLSIATVTKWYTDSACTNEVGTPYNRNLSLVQGDSTNSIFASPTIHEDANYSKTTTSTSGIGLEVLSPAILIQRPS